MKSPFAALALVAVVALMVAFGVPTASACKCVPRTLREFAAAKVNLVRHRILDVDRNSSDVHNIVHTHIIMTFNGCLTSGEVFRFNTSKSSAACGVDFKKDTDYISAFDKGFRDICSWVFSAHRCDFHQEFDTVWADSDARDFLLTRSIYCNDKFYGRCPIGYAPSPLSEGCNTKPVGSCVPLAAATCRENPCNYGKPEYFDSDGRPVCYPCSKGQCATGQTCHDGECVPDSILPSAASVSVI